MINYLQKKSKQEKKFFSRIFLYIYCFPIVVLCSYFLSSEFKGFVLERRVNNRLERLKKRSKTEHLVIWDMMVDNNGYTHQIDNILITNKCIYVLELKNYKGRVYGNYKNNKWYSTIKYTNTYEKNGKTYKKNKFVKNEFYNPILQNKTHCKNFIESMGINKDIPVKNIVVFSNITDTTNVFSSQVINEGELIERIKEEEAKLEECFTNSQLNKLSELYNEKNITCKKRRKKHVRDIIEKYQ